MTKIGATHRPVCVGDDSDALVSISYLTEDAKRILNDLLV